MENMKTININKQQGVYLSLFPDNQPHVRLSEDIIPQEPIKVVVAIKDSITLINTLQTANALSHHGCLKKELHITYLMGARFDRLMQERDSLDIEVVASIINLCGFEKVYLYDVHSPVSLSLIVNSINVNNKKLVDSYNIPNSILLCPDKGAKSKVADILKWNKNITDVVYCDKSRDLSNGRLTLNVLEPELCKNRDCVIVDDLCDGGGTFLMIASQIQSSSLTLIVTHGIFSKGFNELEKVFSSIITSDTYRNHYDSKIVQTIKLSV